MVRVKELDLEGLFWRVEAPEHQIPGRLRFGPTDGGILSLIKPFRFRTIDGTNGSLDDSMAERSDDRDGVRFLGTSGAHLLTLDQFYLTGSSLKSGRMIQLRYRVSTILIGAYFEKDELLNFGLVRVQLANLAQWVGCSGLSIDLDSKENPWRVDGVRIRYKSLPPIEADTNDGSIAVTFPWGWETDRFSKIMVEHKCAVEYRFLEPQSVLRVMEVCLSLRSLVTICVHSPTAIIGSELTRLGADRPINLYTQWIGSGSPRERNIVQRPMMMFSFEDIGGVRGIRAWLNSSNRYAVVIDLLMSNWYAPPLYQEQRYFNAIVAVETLIRIQRTEQNINLGKSLADLAREIEGLFEELVGDVLKWSKTVVQMWDHYVIHPGLRRSSDGATLYRLSESIYVLVVLTLFRECGVSIDSLEKIRSHQHFGWLAKELRVIV